MESFYLCENPLQQPFEGSLGYIYSASKPRYFAALYKLTPYLLPSYEHFYGANKLFWYRPAGALLPDFYLLVVEENRDKAKADQLPKMLEEAVRWYCSVLSSGPVKISGVKAGFALLADFNEQMPGIQILHLEQQDWYVLSYQDGVECFEDFSELQDFLVGMGHAEDVVEVGMLNSNPKS